MRNPAIGELLMKDARVEINTKNNVSLTPFHLACSTGDSKIIYLFLSSNRNINLDSRSTEECDEYPIGTTGYDILSENNLIINVVK